MKQLILIETRIRRYIITIPKQIATQLLHLKKVKALLEDYHAKIQQEKEEKKQPEIEMMEGERRGMI